MSVENVHTINLGKALLSQRQHRAVRAINMIREYVRRHHSANVKIDQELAEQIWARGVRRPPRKVTVELVESDEDVLVVPYKTEDAAPTPELGEPSKGAGVSKDEEPRLPPEEAKPVLEDRSADPEPAAEGVAEPGDADRDGKK